MNERTTVQTPSGAQAFTSVQTGLLQRKCVCGQHTIGGAQCDACNRKHQTLQRSAFADNRDSTAVPAIVHEVLRAPGQPLDGETRSLMESRFDHDFSQVRVRTDARAAASAQAVNALAYTVGRDVVFGPGQYAPQTVEGQRLLAHELAHTVQQGGGIKHSSTEMGISSPGGRDEREAETAAQAISQEQPFALTQNQPAKISRQPAKGGPACVPGPGIPNSNCSAYAANAWWLPLAYVNNATCACRTTPNVPTALCVRKVLQDRLAATPMAIKLLAVSQKPLENPQTYGLYQSFAQSVLTPRIYMDHVIAYRSCCCPSGPAAYPSWIGVTTIPIQPCSLVGLSIRYFGSCSGTPGSW